MTLTQIEYFLAVAENLSFTKTASAMHVSQQVVSYQIKALEEDLGFPLFYREKRRLYLTQTGQDLYDTWHRHRIETEQILADAKIRNYQEQVLRIGIADVDNIINQVMVKISLMNKRFPNIKWDYYLGNMAQIEHAMDTSAIDFAITLSTELADSHPISQTLELQSLQLYILIAKDHPLAERENLTIADLKDETFFLFSEDYSYDANKMVLTDCRFHGFEPQKVRYFSNTSQLEFALLAGQGVFVGYDIFFHNNGEALKKYPIPKLGQLQLSSLVVAWRYPYLESFARAFQGFSDIGTDN